MLALSIERKIQGARQCLKIEIRMQETSSRLPTGENQVPSSSLLRPAFLQQTPRKPYGEEWAADGKLKLDPAQMTSLVFAVVMNDTEKFTSTGKDQGTGLGTYSVKLITEAHNGSIQLDSSSPGMTRVRVAFPAAVER